MQYTDTKSKTSQNTQSSAYKHSEDDYTYLDSGLTVPLIPAGNVTISNASPEPIGTSANPGPVLGVNVPEWTHAGYPPAENVLDDEWHGSLFSPRPLTNLGTSNEGTPSYYDDFDSSMKVDEFNASECNWTEADTSLLNTGNYSPWDVSTIVHPLQVNSSNFEQLIYDTIWASTNFQGPTSGNEEVSIDSLLAALNGTENGPVVANGASSLLGVPLSPEAAKHPSPLLDQAMPSHLSPKQPVQSTGNSNARPKQETTSGATTSSAAASAPAPFRYTKEQEVKIWQRASQGDYKGAYLLFHSTEQFKHIETAPEVEEYVRTHPRMKLRPRRGGRRHEQLFICKTKAVWEHNGNVNYTRRCNDPYGYSSEDICRRHIYEHHLRKPRPGRVNDGGDRAKVRK